MVWPFRRKDVAPPGRKNAAYFFALGLGKAGLTGAGYDKLSADGYAQCVVAYASDMTLLDTSLLPHGVAWADMGFQIASLDHAMWFHRRFRADEWLLYDLHSPSAAGARGFTLGRIFTRDGKLAVSVAQEGLIRRRR